MKKSFNKFFLAPLSALVVSSFVMLPVAEAQRGGGHGGGGARASAGGGGNRQVNNNRADVRTNNVRSTSVNNVNVNKNVNVNVNNNHHGGGWDNGYHPVARAAAVTTAVVATAAVVGSIVNTVPVGCVPINNGGFIYQQCGTVWYQPQGNGYVVVNPPY